MPWPCKNIIQRNAHASSVDFDLFYKYYKLHLTFRDSDFSKCKFRRIKYLIFENEAQTTVVCCSNKKCSWKQNNSKLWT